MSQLQTKIIINGQDNASKAFKSAERSAAALREGVQELAGSLTRFFGLSATVGSFTVFGKASLDAALNLDRLNKAFSTIEGSSARGAARLDYLREVSDRLGQNFYQTAEAAKGFFAAGAGTAVEGDLQKIFESVTEASTALGLSSDEYNRTLLALQQMISKGKVSAEELRQQLGEALPGAFQLFAQAAGVSTAELDKMLERGEVGIDVLGKFADVLHNKYEKGANEAAQGLQAELNRLTMSWEDFKVSFMDTDLARSSIQTVRGAVESMTAGVEEYDTALKASVPALATLILQHKLLNTSMIQAKGGVVAFARSFLELDSAEQKNLITKRALESESVKEAQRALNKAKAAQLAAVETEKAARSELERLTIAKQSASTSKQAQTVLEQESAALRALYAAQNQTVVTSQALEAAHKKLSETVVMATAGVEAAERQSLGLKKALQSESVKVAQTAVEEAKALRASAVAAEQAAQIKYNKAINSQENATTRKARKKAKSRAAEALEELQLAQKNTVSTTEALSRAQIKFDETLKKSADSIKKTSVSAAVSLNILKKAGLGVRSAFSSLLGIFGGPWGAAFTAAAGGLSYLAMQESGAEKYARKHADALSLVSDNADDAARAISAYAEKLQGMSQIKFDLEFQKISREQREILTETGSIFAGDLRQAIFSALVESDRDIAKFGDKLRDVLRPLEKENIDLLKASDIRTIITELEKIAAENDKGLGFDKIKKDLDALLDSTLRLETFSGDAKLKLQQLMDSQKRLAESYALELKELSSEFEQLSHLQDIYTVAGKTAIPHDYIDSLNGMLSLLQRGQMDVETFREELANLSNTASEAGYRNTYFVSMLEKLNNESSGLLSQLAESDKGLRDINAALEQSANMGDSAAASTNRFSRELAALDKAGGQFITETHEVIPWLDRYTANTALAKETSAAFERTQREVALALIQSTAAVAAGMGQWETYERLMRAADEYQKRFAQVDAGKTGGSGKTEAQRRAEAALKALEGYNRELEKLKSTDAEFRDWELKRWVEEQIDLYPQYKKKIEEVAAARRESWAEEDRAEAERKARENSDLRLDFYQQLAEKSGQYNLSLEYANQLIDRQMEEWKNADIPREYLDQMRELLRLEAGTEGWDGAKRAMKSYYADATNMGRQFESFTQTSLSSLEDALVEFTTTGKLSFSDLADSMIRDLVRIAYQAMVVAPLVQSLTGMFGGGSLIKQALGASNAAVNAMFTPSAQGNVFSGGSISDYSGSVVSSPTTFDFNEHLTAFRKGAGLMGEAGPEAVMPLTRGPDGTLGVRSYTPDFSMPTPEVTVNVINNTGQQVQAQTTAAPDGQGGLNIEVVLDQVEAGMVQRDNAGRSRFANHLDRTRGLSRAGRLYRGRGKS